MDKFIKDLKKRATNPLFVAGAAGILYNFLKSKGLIHMEIGTWQTYVDYAAYIATGAGVYSTFEPKNK